MLSAKTIEIIKSTVPVLEQRGTEITKHFYRRMFANHPELLNIFNHTNQRKGRQQTALANAVYAAAKHIDQLETILPAVMQIAHKHRGLGVKPEHYPIVGENLLAAMKEVLGDAATEEVLNAWEEAYGVIADVFIKVEADLYAKAESQEGGWAGFRAFRVERKEKESENVASFYLVPEDGKEIAGFEPGQYITVRAEIPGEKYVQLRHYSLSDAPGKEYYRISVKREDGNEGQPAGKVSTYLHEHVQQGDVLHLSAPAGDFTLDRKDERPAVFIAGGVGLTPLVSMLKTVVSEQPNRRVTFIHAVKNGNLHPLKNELEELARRHGQLSLRFCYSQPTGADKAKGGYQKEGHVDLPWLKQVVDSPNSAFYFCGPLPFMKAVKGMLREWGVAEADQHFEFFGPAAML